MPHSDKSREIKRLVTLLATLSKLLFMSFRTVHCPLSCNSDFKAAKECRGLSPLQNNFSLQKKTKVAPVCVISLLKTFLWKNEAKWKCHLTRVRPMWKTCQPTRHFSPYSSGIPLWEGRSRFALFLTKHLSESTKIPNDECKLYDIGFLIFYSGDEPWVLCVMTVLRVTYEPK